MSVTVLFKLLLSLSERWESVAALFELLLRF